MINTEHSALEHHGITLYRATIIDICGNPPFFQVEKHVRYIHDGALLVNNQGRIVDCLAYADVTGDYRQLVIAEKDMRPGYIIPGFVDTHMHFPQTVSVHAWADGNLLRWLDACIFPDEIRLEDPSYAVKLAQIFTARRIAAGTTSALVMGSAFPAAQDALYRQTHQAGLRIISGRGIQTVGPISANKLIFSEESTDEMVRREIDTWHNSSQGRIQVGIMPRFALSVTEYTLQNLLAIYEEYKDQGIYFHTHLSESCTDEIPQVLHSYHVARYLDIFDSHLLKTSSPSANINSDGFLGKRTIFAHAVYASTQELHRLAQTGCSIAHCPVSQQFLGSGIMPWKKVIDSGVTVALGSDIGAGDRWAISQVANAAFKVHAGPETMHPVFLTPAQLLFLCTLAGAQALDMQNVYGNFDSHKDADFLVIDPENSPLLHDMLMSDRGQEREGSYQSNSYIQQEVFRLIMGLDEQAIKAVFVRGKQCLAPEISL